MGDKAGGAQKKPGAKSMQPGGSPKEPRETRLVFGLALAEDDGAQSSRSMPIPRAAVDPLVGKASAVEDARRQAGVAPKTLPLWLPDEWMRLDFPFEDAAAAAAFVEAAFCHRGWPLLAKFRSDFDAAYAGLPGVLRRQAAAPARDVSRAADQIRRAMRPLRPRVVAALVQLEAVAVELLRQRLDEAIGQARSQARDLLVMPVYGGLPVAPEALLDARAARGGPWVLREGDTPLSATDAAKRLRASVERLAPAAAQYSRAHFAKNVQAAHKAIGTALQVELTLTTGGTAPLAGHGVDVAAREIERALAEGALGDALSAAVRDHRDALAKWAEFRETFVASRRAFAGEFPVLHRFGFDDVIDGAKEDDTALGARVLRKLTGIYSGATQVFASHVEGRPGSTIQPKRPGRMLERATRSKDPPDDPVNYVIERADGTVWKHPSLIQAATKAIAEQPSFGGPMSILDDFTASVSAQAIAEFSREQQRASIRGVVEAIGVTAGMIALHFVAPPLAFVADATLATGDLSSGLGTFGVESALSRCAFDPTLALGEEPSVAWFLASQAFNVLTVG